MNLTEKNEINTASIILNIDTLKQEDNYYYNNNKVGDPHIMYKKLKNLLIGNEDIEYKKGDYILYEDEYNEDKLKLYKVVNITKTLYKVQEVKKIIYKKIEYCRGEHLHALYNVIKFNTDDLYDEITKIKKKDCLWSELDKEDIDQINKNAYLEIKCDFYKWD